MEAGENNVPPASISPGAHNAHGGFTLIELLVVLAILAVLASLILGIAGHVQQSAAVRRTGAELAALTAALENYRADQGDYPTNGNAGLGPESLYAVLTPAEGTVYLPLDQRSLSPSGLTDPFGQAYQYRYPGAEEKSGTEFFDLWSYAGSGRTNDIPGNWEFWIRNW